MFGCAVDLSPTDVPVSGMCKGLEFKWQEDTSAVVCQARTEETILVNSPKYSSASMGAVEVANRLVEGRQEDDWSKC